MTTVSSKDLRRVIGYVRYQKEHHREKDLFENLERREGKEEKQSRQG